MSFFKKKKKKKVEKCTARPFGGGDNKRGSFSFQNIIQLRKCEYYLYIFFFLFTFFKATLCSRVR